MLIGGSLCKTPAFSPNGDAELPVACHSNSPSHSHCPFCQWSPALLQGGPMQTCGTISQIMPGHIDDS